MSAGARGADQEGERRPAGGRGAWVGPLGAVLARWRAALQRSGPARLVQRYLDDNLPNWAAAIAYHAFFSLFPLLLLLLAVVGLVLRDPERLASTAQGIVDLFPPEAAQPILDVLRGSRENAGLLGAVSTAGLVYSSSALLGSLETAFNQVYRLPDRGFLQQKLMALGLLVLLTALVLLALGAASLAAALQALTQRAAGALAWLPGAPLLAALGELGSAVAWALSAIWVTLLMLLLYALVPNRRPNLPAAVPGALVATALVLATSQLFPLYLEWFGRFNRYGAAFGLTLLLLTWLYFLAHILLFGVTLNALLEEQQRSTSST